MKKALALLLLVFSTVLAQQTSRSLTNDDVVNMLKIGLPEQSIIAAIETGPVSFDISAEGLSKVKSSGASKAILDAMVKSQDSSLSSVTLFSATMAEDKKNAAIPLSVDITLESNSPLSNFLFSSFSAIKPSTCVKQKADTMQECHKNYLAGCTYSENPKYDAYLNYLKNLMRNPNTKPESLISKANFASLDKSARDMGLNNRNHGELQKELRELGDGRIRAMMGYLYHGFPTNEGEGESCNCYLLDDEAVDYHIGIGFKPFPLSQDLLTKFRNGADIRKKEYKKARKTLEQASAVVEMTPHYRAQIKPRWTIERLRRAIGMQVLVVGQLLVDNAHMGLNAICSQPESDSKACWRYSAWEIHPATQFYVCTSAAPCSADSNIGWTMLEKMP